MRRLVVALAALAVVALTAASGAQAYVYGQPYDSGAYRASDPLSGHPWYVDYTYGVWWDVIRQYGSRADGLKTAGGIPMGKSFGSFEPHPETNLKRYLERAQSEEPGAIPFVGLSRIEHQSCPYVDPGSAYSERTIDDWVSRFSQGIGNFRVAVLVEADKLAVLPCLPRSKQAQRYRELRYEIHTLHVNNPNAIVYLDAGASDWLKAPTITRELKQADVAEAQGFALGASHFDWTSHEISYGLQISRALGGKHFVVNTSDNGWGPRPRYRSKYYHPGCTPTGEGMGLRPTVNTPDLHIDGFVWLNTPGFESGVCLGQSSGYGFQLDEALSLIKNANPRF